MQNLPAEISEINPATKNGKRIWKTNEAFVGSFLKECRSWRELPKSFTQSLQ
jgi:hypothetical protein